MNKRNYAFGKANFLMLAAGMLIVIIGFCLMSGGGSDESTFNESIFSTQRIKVAPVVCLVGFVSMIYAILHKPCTDSDDTSNDDTSKQ